MKARIEIDSLASGACSPPAAHDERLHRGAALWLILVMSGLLWAMIIFLMRVVI